MTVSPYCKAVTALDHCISNHATAFARIKTDHNVAAEQASSDFDKRCRRADSKANEVAATRERVKAVLGAPHVPASLVATFTSPPRANTTPVDDGQRVHDPAALEADIVRLVNEIDQHRAASRERRRAEAAAREKFHEAGSKPPAPATATEASPGSLMSSPVVASVVVLVVCMVVVGLVALYL